MTQRSHEDVDASSSALLARFGRITTTHEYFPEIDGLRFAAIFAVILVHVSNELLFRTNNAVAVQDYYRPLIAVLHQCSRGVEVFFVISGFVLGRPFAKQRLLDGPRVSLSKYFLRRVTRLEPPYVLAITLCAILFVLVNHTPSLVMLPHYLATAFYLHGLIYHYPPFFSTVVWSLAVEVQFYLIVPLLVLIFEIPGGRARRGLLVAAVLLCGVGQHIFLGEPTHERTSVAQSTLLYFLQYFLAGFLLSDLHLVEMPRWKKSWKWDVVSLIAWPLIFCLSSWWIHAALPLLILAAFVAAFQGQISNRFFRLSPVATIGGMCYSIYLLHVYVMAFAFRGTRHLMVFHDFMANFVTQLFLLSIPILAVSSAYFVLVERPCMDPGWPQKLASSLLRRRPIEGATDCAGASHASLRT